LSRKHRYPVLQNMAMLLNWLAAGLLLLSYPAQKYTPAHHTFLAVFGLVYPVLLFINLFFILFWIFLKNSRWILSLLVILTGFSYLKTNLAFHRTKDMAARQTMKVLSYNVQGFAERNNAPYNPQVKGEILSFLLRQKADILCLQEYSGRKADLLLKKRGKNTYFHSYYTQKGSKNTGLAIAAKYKIIKSNYLKYKGYRTFAIYSDMLYGTDTLRVINVHLASISLKQDDLDLLTKPPSPAWKKQNVEHHFLDIYHKLQKAFILRERQIKQILKIVQTSRFPVILCGDFNDTPSSWAYHRTAGLLTDAFVKKGFGLSPTYAGPLPLLRIDYLFAGKEFRILAYKKHHFTASDHFPVSMEINYVKKQKIR
jgi:endonuclease/exonuclease/phosphatase family metal-dependent hydrolase